MKRVALALFLVVALFAPSFQARADDAVLTNADVIRLAHSGISDSVLATMVRSRPGNYDLSTNAIVAVKNAGAGDETVRAMIESGAPRSTASGLPGFMGAPSPLPAKVTLIDGTARHDLAAATASVAQSDMSGGGLSHGSAGIGMLSGIAGSALGMIVPGAGMIGALGGLFGHHTKPSMPEMHQVWALAGSHAATVAAQGRPAFEVSYDNISGLDPDRFAPALVQLVTTKDNWRVVGASKATLDPSKAMNASTSMLGGSGAGPYSIDSLDEKRVAAHVETLGRGRARLTPDAPLPGGEYAIVLRLSDAHASADGEAGEQTLSRVIASAWDFSIAGAAATADAAPATSAP